MYPSYYIFIQWPHPTFDPSKGKTPNGYGYGVGLVAPPGLTRVPFPIGATPPHPRPATLTAPRPSHPSLADFGPLFAMPPRCLLVPVPPHSLVHTVNTLATSCCPLSSSMPLHVTTALHRAIALPSSVPLPLVLVHAVTLASRPSPLPSALVHSLHITVALIVPSQSPSPSPTTIRAIATSTLSPPLGSPSSFSLPSHVAPPPRPQTLPLTRIRPGPRKEQKKNQTLPSHPCHHTSPLTMPSSGAIPLTLSVPSPSCRLSIMPYRQCLPSLTLCPCPCHCTLPPVSVPSHNCCHTVLNIVCRLNEREIKVKASLEW